MRKEPHDVDDGWWEGELRGQQGLFPSLVVEPCGPDGAPFTPSVSRIFDFAGCLSFFSTTRSHLICPTTLQEDITPPSSAPPVFTPPQMPEDFLMSDDPEKLLSDGMILHIIANTYLMNDLSLSCFN